jgi:hypothetical protein
MIKDHVAVDGDYTKSRKEMIFDALREICHEFDVAEPIWLLPNIDDFAYRGKVRFNADNFIEQIDFDYLEIQIIEE